MISTSSLQQIVNVGGSLVLTYPSYSSSSLELLAKSLHEGATLTIKVEGSYSTSTLVQIAKAKPGQVVFDFTA